MLCLFFVAALALAVAIAFIPLKKLVRLYMYIVSCGLLFAAHIVSNLYVNEEKASTFQGSVLENKDSLLRACLHIAIQGNIAAIIGYLLNTKKWMLPLFAFYMIPMLARFANYPAEHLHRVHNFSFLLNAMMVVGFIFYAIPRILDLLKSYAQKTALAIQLYGWMPFILVIWFRVALPLQFLIFWLTLFIVQVYRYFNLHDHLETIEGYIVMILTCMANSCVTPITLIGLCVTISYLAYALLTATKFFLLGRGAWIEPDTVVQRGYTEGFTMFLLALQTGLIEMKTTQRAFLMCIVLFIVVSSLIQSMFEITDPILLALGASQSKNAGKHFRAILLSTFLWMFPLYMAWTISQFFDMDFWLMVVISSCVLTSVQVMGSLVTYALFVYDAMCDNSIENLDDYVYYAKSTTRVLEFVVAVIVVCYGVRESLFGEWSWVNATILIIHCYFNVWQRLQVGWKSYLLRREASKKVDRLRDATKEELETLNDICCVCYQSMSQAKITNCGHYFHAICLRKWLYVQEKCPMCHKEIQYENIVETDPGNTDNAENDIQNHAENVPGYSDNCHESVHNNDSDLASESTEPSQLDIGIRNDAPSKFPPSQDGDSNMSGFSSQKSEIVINSNNDVERFPPRDRPWPFAA